jgi:hypothetical protein
VNVLVADTALAYVEPVSALYTFTTSEPAVGVWIVRVLVPTNVADSPFAATVAVVESPSVEEIVPPVIVTYVFVPEAVEEGVTVTPIVFAGPAIPPTPPSPVPAACVIVVVAYAGRAENPPSANAAAATNAMRLIDVFVDIIFLSRKVAAKNFFTAAWFPNAFS